MDKHIPAEQPDTRMHDPAANKRTIILISSISLLSFLPFLGSYGIIDPSDGLYAEGAREMVQSGNFLTPHFNFTPFYEKPILIYWLISAGYKIFGVSEFAARLPASLSGVLTAIAIYLFAAKYLGRRCAKICALVLLANPLFLVVGHLALTDMPLTCLATVAILSFFHAQELASSKSKLYIWLSYMCLALTMLLKGPVIIIVVALALAVYQAALRWIEPGREERNYWQVAMGYQPILGVAIVLCVAAPWFIAENAATNGQFIQEFFFRQNFGRLSGAVNHTEPFWFYIPIVLGAFLPWTLFAPYAVPFTKKLLRKRKILSSRQRLLILCLSWMLVNYGIFSGIRTKLPTYILPAVPLTCVFIGAAISAFLRKSPSPRKSRSLREPWSLKNKLVPILTVWTLVIAMCVPAGIIHVYNGKHADLRRIVESAPSSNLATLWRDTSSGVFYHRQKITVVFTVEDLQKYLKTPEKPHMMVVTNDLIPFLKLEMHKGNLFPINQIGGFSLFNLDEAEGRR
jgi:4-amino-4-deoxy-L-arabinose transferase-like glycosyltransferase